MSAYALEGQEGWYPIVAWGTHWYEADGQWEVILEDTSDIEIHIETLDGEDLKVETVSLEELPERTDYSLDFRLKSCFWMSVPAGCVLKMWDLANFIRHQISL